MEGLQDLYDLVEFDGMWIDMNEPSNFDNCKFGECPDLVQENTVAELFELTWELQESLNETEDNSYYKDIPWWPSKNPPYFKTLSLDGYHVVNKSYYDLYHTHNLYGTL